ncbi:Amidase domain-containing protein [Mycena chlorophos]|uniref:Amidase domain-containing protein n=1 Tax=Mycena chlorophos TaxID=658473 RepID=A0A8H6TPW2_MYCCL|nr:Amidase domain-containing protein [Mycena chlorophos]
MHGGAPPLPGYAATPARGRPSTGKIPGEFEAPAEIIQIRAVGIPKPRRPYRWGFPSAMARWAFPSVALALVGALLYSNPACGFSVVNPFSIRTVERNAAAEPVRQSLPLQAMSTPAFPDLYEASVRELQSGLDSGMFTSVDLVKAYFARIDEVNLKGPALRAVLEMNPSALAQAAALDEERKTSGKRSELHGIPILLKDNIATLASEGMNTTAGSFSLLDSIVPDDAGVVKRLRAAGAIILGKANLSEWAHFRGNIASGWSGRGGQCKPQQPRWDQADFIPISEHQDTVGPLTRSLTDGAIVLSIIAGKDPNDNFTLAQPSPVPDFTKALNKDALRGKRIGVPRKVFLNDSITGNDPSVNVAFEAALVTIKELGATVVDPADLPSAEEFITSNNETIVLNVDFKASSIQLNAWFQSLLKNPSGVESLADLIEFDNANPTLEEPAGFEDQSQLIQAEATEGRNATFFAALAADHELGSTQGIDFVLKKFNLDALVLPAPGFTTTIAAVVGYPIVTVPLGFYPDNVTIGSAGPETVYPAPGVPFGLSFLGTAFSEFDLISFGFAYEQKTQTRLKRKAFPAAIPTTQLADVVGR